MRDIHDMENAIIRMGALEDELDVLLYKMFDASRKPTDDEVMNIMIGIKEINKARYDMLWESFTRTIPQQIKREK